MVVAFEAKDTLATTTKVGSLVVVASEAKDTLATTTKGSRGTFRVPKPVGDSPCSAITLLAEEPAGKIPTVSAGVARVEATLSYRPGDAPPPISRLPEPPPGARYYPAREDAASACRFFCEVRALRVGGLAVALESLLRAVAAHAALTDAVLEVRAVRAVEPIVYPAPLVERLARDLWEAGLEVGFGPSWVPVPEGGLAVGSGGSEAEIEGFLREHPAWRVVAPGCGPGRNSTYFAGALDRRSASG